MPRRNKKACTLYYSAVITDRVHRDRNLYLLNPATTKRTLRVAQAFQWPGQRCFVLSPGMLPRTGGHGQVFPSDHQRVGGVPVITIAQWAVKYLGYLLAPFTAINAARRIARKRRIDTVIIFCYFFHNVVFAFWCHFVYGSKIIVDLEDICMPRFSDWERGSETSPMLQIRGWFLMKLVIALAYRVIILSHKFADVVPERKILLIPGCQKVRDGVIKERKDTKVNVLMSGGITFENGMGVLADAIRSFKAKQNNLRLLVCGSGKIDWLKEQLKDVTNVEVKFFSFLGNEEFEDMYRQVDVCLALQNPNGRQGRFKSPSKGFEAICSGKALIVSDIGDFGLLPDDICYHLRPYTAEKLAEIFSGLEPKSVVGLRERAHRFAKEHYDIPVARAYLMDRMGVHV